MKPLALVDQLCVKRSTIPKRPTAKGAIWNSIAWNSFVSLTTIAAGLSIAPNAFADLHFGDTGEEVRNLQTALGLPVDGIYGSWTEQAVILYQQSCGLQVDGIAGTSTLSSLAAGNCIVNGGYTPLEEGFIEDNPDPADSTLCRYEVVVPGSSSDRLAAVRRIVPNATIANDDRRGSYIKAGCYRSSSAAGRIVGQIHSVGLLDARID